MKGTDGPEALRRIAAAGARPVAAERTRRALQSLCAVSDAVTIFAAAGPMGADIASQLGFKVAIIGAVGPVTTSEDTRRTAALMAEFGLDLVLVAGGDGTIRDVLDGAPHLPLLGIPTGVKMHSAVFAVSPAAAGELARRLVAAPSDIRWREAEVMDIDETSLCKGTISARLYGYARVPDARQSVQASKSPAQPDDEAALDALARRLVREMDPACMYVLGCGTTIRRIKQLLGSDGTLLGVDVALGGRMIATDVDDARLERLTASAPVRIVVGVTGGQGYIFGRGNQQISARVLARAGRNNILVLAGAKKLHALDPACLRVDAGDDAVDAMLSGYMRVLTAPGRATMMRVAA